MRSYHPTAPRRTASDCLAFLNVSSGNGTPTRSKAAPPIGSSSKLKSSPVTSKFESFVFSSSKDKQFKREIGTFERSSKTKSVNGDGDDFVADAIAGKHRYGVPFTRCVGGASDRRSSLEGMFGGGDKRNRNLGTDSSRHFSSGLEQKILVSS